MSCPLLFDHGTDPFDVLDKRSDIFGSMFSYPFNKCFRFNISTHTVIRTMLEGQFREAQDNIIRFPDITGYILERVVRYLHYKAQYTNASMRIPDFIIEPEVALELLIAAKYLDC